MPDGLISQLAIRTGVDYCAKVLQGERLFNLLLYGILKTDRLSQRFLEDVFQSAHFKCLFNYSIDLKVTHSSLSERLSKINLDFFQKAYECIYKRFNSLYSEAEQQKLRIKRVDSSMVAETSSRLRQGMLVGKKKRGQSKGKEKKQLKYSMAYDGSAVEKALFYSDSEFLSEDKALFPLLEEMIKKDREHQNLYVFDRGMCALESFEKIAREKAFFLCRIKTNRKCEVVENLLQEDTDRDCGRLQLVSDQVVHLYDDENKCFSSNSFRGGLSVGEKKLLIRLL